MESRHVEYFLATVDNDGLALAAEALGVTKPSLSKGLRNLERDLGVELFHRVGRGLVRSARGKRPAKCLSQHEETDNDVGARTVRPA